MGVLPDLELMPDDDDESYRKHVVMILIGWTALVLLAAVALATVTIVTA